MIIILSLFLAVPFKYPSLSDGVFRHPEVSQRWKAGLGWLTASLLPVCIHSPTPALEHPAEHRSLCRTGLAPVPRFSARKGKK